jgi:hypothetical protein
VLERSTSVKSPTFKSNFELNHERNNLDVHTHGPAERPVRLCNAMRQLAAAAAAAVIANFGERSDGANRMIVRDGARREVNGTAVKQLSTVRS